MTKDAQGYERFSDGELKPFISEADYDALRDDDKFLYNRGIAPPDGGMVFIGTDRQLANCLGLMALRRSCSKRDAMILLEAAERLDAYAARATGAA